jgi:hypothetical protein
MMLRLVSGRLMYEYLPCNKYRRYLGCDKQHQYRHDLHHPALEIAGVLCCTFLFELNCKYAEKLGQCLMVAYE